MTAGGYALRLRFDAGLTGPCMRCLEPAAPVTAVDVREVHQPGGGEELTSPYVHGEDLDLGAWAHDAYALALPAQVVCTPDCAGPVPRVRREPQHRRARAPPRPRARPALGEAARAAARLTAMTGADTEAVLRRTYDAFNARDVEAVLAGMHDDVDWPNAWEGGRVRGRDAVRAYWTRQFAEIDPRVTPTAFADAARRPGRGRRPPGRPRRRGDLLSEGDVVHVYAFRDGLVERMDVEPGGG